MKNYTITVNGNVYNVTVEEGTTAGAAPTVSAAKAAPAPKAAPAAPKAAAPAGAAGRHRYARRVLRALPAAGRRPADDPRAVPVIQTGCTPFGNIFFGGKQQ